MMKVEQLSKKYGKKIAVNNVSLILRPTVYGLLGPQWCRKNYIITFACRGDTG